MLKNSLEAESMGVSGAGGRFHLALKGQIGFQWRKGRGALNTGAVSFENILRREISLL